MKNDQTPTSLLYCWIIGYCNRCIHCSLRCTSMCSKSNKKLFNVAPSYTRIMWMLSFKFESNSSVCFRLCGCVRVYDYWLFNVVALHEWHASISFDFELRHLRAVHSTHNTYKEICSSLSLSIQCWAEWMKYMIFNRIRGNAFDVALA